MTGTSDDTVVLPSSWTSTTIGQVCGMSSGGTPRRTQSEFYGGPIPWLKSGELNDGVIFEAEEHITRAGLENSSAKIFPRGTVLIALYGATIGKLGILGVEAATNQAICGLEPNAEQLDPKYLLLCLLARRHELRQSAYGGAQSNISQSIVRNMQIPLPPLGEQRFIVAKLESILARTRTAKQELSRILELTKRLRMAILSKAFRGQLTERITGGEPADMLLVRIRTEKARRTHSSPQAVKKKQEQVRSEQTGPQALPKGWSWTTVGDIAFFVGSGITPLGGRNVYVSDGILFIRSQNVLPDGLHLDDAVRIPTEIDESMSRTRVKPGDVLLNITGASIGRSTYVPQDLGPANVNQHVCIIRTESFVNPIYLSSFLNSPSGQSQIMSSQSGVTREGLNYRQLSSIIVPLAPSKEQESIARIILHVMSFLRRVENQTAKATEKLASLERSILSGAFEGRLFLPAGTHT